MWSGQLAGDSSGNTAAWFFTKRGGGVSEGDYGSLNLATHVGDDPDAVATNRDRLAQVMGVSPQRMRFLQAQHGAIVHTVTEQNVNAAPPSGDGLVTTEFELGLVALAADCVPLVLADVDRAVIGVVHCGWPGVVAGVVPHAIDAMVAAGALPQEITALAGPAICGRCYEVPKQRQDAVAAVVPEAVCTSAGGGPAVDVRLAVQVQLAARGIAVELIGGCTAEDSNMYSFRRDGTTGRHGGGIVMREAG